MEMYMEFDTANKVAGAGQVVRIQIASWDVPTDYVVMEDALELLSVGERCMHVGFSFVWVHDRHHVSYRMGHDTSSFLKLRV